MRESNTELERKTNLLTKEIKMLRNPHYSYFSGSSFGSFQLFEGTIAYTKLFHASTNVEGDNLDTSTGVFTVGYPGVYTVTWSLNVWWGNGEPNTLINLLKNGVVILEAEQKSWGASSEMGSRTLILHLQHGDTLALYCMDCSATITRVMFSVSLGQFDIKGKGYGVVPLTKVNISRVN